MLERLLSKRQVVANVDRAWEIEDPSTVGGDVSWYNHYGKQCGGSSEN